MFTPSSWETEIGGSLEFQHSLHGENLPQNKTKKIKKKETTNNTKNQKCFDGTKMINPVTV